VEDGLELWCFYNRALSWWAEKRSDLHLLEFDADPAVTAHGIADLVSRLGLSGPNPSTGQEAPFFDPSLVSRPAGAPVEHRAPATTDSPARRSALGLYRKLQARSAENPERRGPAVSDSPRQPEVITR
jgi:hypothetical protein